MPSRAPDGAEEMWPATDDTLMMQPLRRCLIAGSTAWMQRMTPK